MIKDASNAEYHAFYDQLSSGIFLIRADEKEEIVFANRAALEIYDCESFEELRNLTAGVFRGMIRPESYRPLKVLIQKGAPFTKLYYEFFSAKKHFRMAEGTLSCISGDLESPLYLLQLYSINGRMESYSTDFTGLLSPQDLYHKAYSAARKNQKNGKFADFVPVYFDIANFRTYNRSFGIQQGDLCIKKVADTLKEVFPDGLLGHLSADNFAAILPRENLESKIQKICSDIDRYIDNRGISLKAGILVLPENASPDEIRHSFDRAKLACESVKNNMTRSFAFYMPGMEENFERRLYILKNFDRALDEGHIKVYYQPVVRTLSGKLCSYEALARWEDPKFGFISPAVFVPTLENARLIGRLDAFMIDNVCRLIRDRLSNGYQMLPVSLNLSKLDFDLIHPLKLIEETVQKYGIPKEYIHVEITESVMAWNRETLSGLLKSFRIAGYEVWMDDFGSEYSSLNTLHNYTFDLLKIDMEFFRNFDETSRKIISSVVQMAKTLGLQTLAEGVENKDQLDFLRKIGCGKIQGYYYSRPLLYEDLVSLCQEKGLELEDERESHVYDAAGLVNTLSDTPAGLFSFDDEKMVYLSANDGFLNLFSMGTRSDLDEINRMINAPDSPLYAKIQSLGRNAYENGTSTMVVVQREKYLKLKAEFVAGTKSWWIGKIHVTDLSTLAEVNDTRWMDHAFRTLASLYEAMYLIRPTDDEVSVCWTTSAYETGNNEYSGIRKFFIGFADEMVFPSDRKRFLQFVMPSNLLKAVENTGRIDLSSVFRIREGGNSYHWKVLQVTLMQNGKENDILLTFREDLWERGTPGSWRLFPEFAASLQREAAVRSVDGVRDFTEEDVLYRNLFYSLIHYSDLHLYWKDRNLKTLGVSDIVARDLGVENPSSLVGTTLKDLSFYIHNDEIHREEEEIVRTGKGRFGEKQLYMVNGVPMNMRLTEFPFYNENRQIDGLMGYSVFDERENSQPAKMMSDRETDFLDPFGTVLYGRQYDVTLRENGNDYCVLIMFLREYEKLLKTIGKDNFEKVIQLISESIREENFMDVMVGRFSESSFLLFARSSAAERLLHFGERLSKKLSKKQTVGGMTLSFDLSFDIVYGSEAESFGEVLHWLYGKLYKDVRGETAGHVLDHSKILMKIAESAPESIMLIDPENYDIVYMNAAARGVLGIPENRKENAGKCYEIVHGANSPCAFCHVRTLHRTCFYNWSNVWKKPGRKFLNRDILIPWKNRYVDMHIAFDLSDYLKTELEIDRRIYQEIWTNDAIYQSFMEEDPETGIQKLLKMIGESMKAERVLIFEKKCAQTVNCTYEWHRGGVAPLLQELRGILDSHLRGLYKGFAESQVVMVQDYAKFQRENPDFKMPIAGLQNFVSGQILISGKSDGFTFVVNADPENFDLSEVMFITLTNFVASILRYRNNMLEIEEKGLRDYLTGCYNRRGLEKYLRNRSSVGKAAFISGDINGLKRINDTLGHSAGDAAILKVSRILMNEADLNHVFRMGGDEFLLILEDYDISAVRHIIARIKSEAHIQGLSIALGFSIHEGPVENIDEILIEADTEMYDDKGKHYHRRSTDQTGAKEQTDGDRNRV